MVVISSIITNNFFVTRNKQPMTIRTNRMCISRDDNCVNTLCFPTQLPKILYDDLLSVLSSTSVIRVVPPVFSFLLCDEFLKAYFLSMPQLSMYVSIWPDERFWKVSFKVEDQGTWRRHNLHAAILWPPAKRIQITCFKLYRPSDRVWKKWKIMLKISVTLCGRKWRLCGKDARLRRNF